MGALDGDETTRLAVFAHRIELSVGVRREALDANDRRHPEAGDVGESLGAQVRPELGLGHHVVRELGLGPGRHHRVAAVGGEQPCSTEQARRAGFIGIGIRLKIRVTDTEVRNKRDRIP